MLTSLSVFFPAYNVEIQIEATVRKAYAVIPKIAQNYEIIVVNDGSRDRTGEILADLKKEYPDLNIITHLKNRGYGGALKSGLYAAKHDWVVFTDSDGQFDISELPNLIVKQKESNADLVIGYYLKRQVAATKIITSKIWELVVFLLFGLKVRDIDCGFKLISQRVIKEIPKLESERGAFISSELLIKAKKYCFEIAETGVHHFPRLEGKGTGRDPRVIINSFKDLFKLYLHLKKTKK